MYDAIQGNGMLRLLCRNFSHLLRQFGICFGSAADVACGTGGFVRYLARLGIPVFGVDRSSSMLRLARKRNPGSNVVLLKQDMVHLRLPFPVDLISCNFDSLNYLLSTKKLARALRAFRGNLARKGHLVFDMVTDAWDPRGGAHRQEFTTPWGSSTWRVSWDPDRSIRTVVMSNRLPCGDGTSRLANEVHVERAYPIGEIVGLLTRLHLEILGVIDAHSLRPASGQTVRAIYVALRH